MQPVPPDTDDSPAGEVPGSPGVPAFTLSASEPSAIPVLIAAPHAGRAYPASLLAAMRSPGFSTLRLEDRLADRLGQAVARATGAALLVAHAPRAMIDLNRAPDDIDWEMVEGGPADAPNGHGFGRRARTGLGLIPRRLPGLGELWKRRLPLAEMEARIATVHAPYHACLADALGRLRERWGAALLIDLHSMPPLAVRGVEPAARIVLGDRFGAASHGRLVAEAFAHFRGNGFVAAHNRPYAGGYVLERHARPDRGIHAIQLEVDRSTYLDSRLAEPGEGFEAMAAALGGLVVRLAVEVAALGRETPESRWIEAAE